jgi:hypothetical protein
MMNFTLTPSDQTVRALKDRFMGMECNIRLGVLARLVRTYRKPTPLVSLDDFLVWVAIAEYWDVPFVSLFYETADSAYDTEDANNDTVVYFVSHRDLSGAEVKYKADDKSTGEEANDGTA